MEYGGNDCSDEELPKVEAGLRAQGYRLAMGKTDEKQLVPWEYIKSSYHGSAVSPEGPRRWTLRWRVS